MELLMLIAAVLWAVQLIKQYMDEHPRKDPRTVDTKYSEMNADDPDDADGDDVDGAASSGNTGTKSGRKSGKKKSGKNGMPDIDIGKLKGTVIAVIAAIAVVCVGMNCYYNVDEQENAVVTMFGEVIRTDTAGLHFKIPFVQNVQIVDITTHGTGLGYSVENDGQTFASNTDGLMITKDFNFIDIDFYMEYRVSDPVAYLYNSNEPEEIMKNIALAAIRSTVINYDVDEAITTAKLQIQADVKEKIVAELAEQNIGLAVVNITVQDSTPPTDEIIAAFKSVETAKQGKDTALNNANKYKNEQLPAAQAEADRIVQNAEAVKAARIAEAEGQVARFNAMYEQYKVNPLITKQRLFYETIESVLPDTKVIITDGSTQTVLPLDSFVSGSGAGSADASTGSEEAGAGN